MISSATLKKCICKCPDGSLSKINQSSVGEEMAAVHFTTVPCEPYTAHRVHKKPYL